MKKILTVLVVLLLLGGSRVIGQAEQGFIIADIRVVGLQRVSEGTLFNALPVQVGDTLDRITSARVIERVFATGYFEDVRVTRAGNVMVLTVTERASILEIKFKGNRKIGEAQLQEITDAVELSAGRIFNQSSLDRALQEMKAFYFSRGYYSVDVDVDITEEDENQVSLVFEFYEASLAKVKKISIIGNEFYKDRKLLSQFPFKVGGFTLFGHAKRLYSRAKLEAGIESLESFYLDRGFLQFEIISTQVSITADKRDIYITISMNEGARYTYTGSVVSGETIFPPSELLDLVTMKKDKFVSRVKLSESREAIVQKLTDGGYINAIVTPEPVVDEGRGTVSYNFIVDPGPRVYVRRIHIIGNTVTRDEVVRRELRQHEGGWYSAAKVRRSRVRLQRLGFFQSVNITTEEVPETNDQVDLIVNVAEQATGSLLFSVGYDDDDGVSGEIGVTQRNFLGTGNELSFEIRNTETTDSYSFRYRNPYSTKSGVSRTIYLGQREVDATQTSSAGYTEDDANFGVLYDIPFSEYSQMRIGVEYARIELRATGSTPNEFREQICNNSGGTNRWVGSATGTFTVGCYDGQNNDVSNPILEADQATLNLGYAYDTRDDIRFPTEGARHSVDAEVTLPGSGLQFYKSTLRSTMYRSLSERVVLRGNIELGYGDGYGNTEFLPFYKNYYAGGASTVRGYDDRSLGPRSMDTSTSTNNTIGGNIRALFGTELFVPVSPGEGKQNQRFGLFLDGGQVYGDGDFYENTMSGGGMRFSTGVAFYWFSPLGPISIGYSVPLNDKPEDDTREVHFTLGTGFN